LAGYIELGSGQTNYALAEFRMLEKEGHRLANEVHFRASQEGLAQTALLEENIERAHGLIEGAISTSPSPSDRAAYLIYLAGIDAFANKPFEAEAHIKDALSVDRSDEQIAAAVRILAFLAKFRVLVNYCLRLKIPAL
jgi:hypothetical protein